MPPSLRLTLSSTRLTIPWALICPGCASMETPEILYAVQLIQREYWPVETDQQTVNGALTADSKTALHVAFNTELCIQVALASDAI